MARQQRKTAGPAGGLQAGPRALRGWSWNGRGALASKAVRCKRAEWYLARARSIVGGDLTGATLLVAFLRNGDVLARRCLRLVRPDGGCCGDELLGWIKTPDDATHLQLHLADASLAAQLAGIVLHDVSERDPKCHPLANIPRWNTYRPPFSLERVVLPASLAALADGLVGVDVKFVSTPKSVKALAQWARGAACVLDPEWVTDLGLTLDDIERVASSSWLIADLEVTARLLSAAGVATAEIVHHASSHGIMSARVEYADVPTRGVALQDVVPYTVVDARGRFAMRAIKATRAWKRYADETGFATLLSGETPWESKSGDVLSAMRAVGGGELIATDLPWLVAGRQGALLMPRIAHHLLRMHLGQPASDHVQYWNRWDDGNVVVRDISDLSRRYPPLCAIRWASATPGLAHLGILLGPLEGEATSQVVIRTGRIDGAGVHAGLPPEPLVIFMKWLAREARERTSWARRHLRGRAVLWQFDTADGLKHAANFDAAPSFPERGTTVVKLRLRSGVGCVSGEETAEGSSTAPVIEFSRDEGLYGDGSLAFQDTLTRRLRRVIERAGAG